MSEARILYDTVIKNNYCIGCGACALIKGSPFEIEMDKYGQLVANSNVDSLSNCSTQSLLEVCPFSGKSKNENELSDLFFPEVNKSNDKIGKYISCFVGYVNEDEFRKKGSSGGIAKWIGYQLLKLGKIDYFVQIQSNSTNDSDALLFDYKLFDNCNDILLGSKSAYYPTTLVNILKEIENKPGRYAITGVPCNIKSLRLLSLKNEVLKEKIKYTIGIVCGGMKSANYSKLVGWELGVHPNNLVKIDFRRKYENRPANEKIYQVWSSNPNQDSKYKDVSQIYGTGYASGFFKPNVCDYCDDVLAETADIAIGDAWLKKYVNDPKGTSVIVVRNSELNDILLKANEEQKIHIEEISAEDVAFAQKGGLRHRREALSRRIAKKEKAGEWVPPKRVMANQFKIGRKRKRIYDLRERIAKKSHVAFSKALEKNNLSYFHRKMNPLILWFVIINFSELLPKLPRRLFLFIYNKFFK